MSQDKEIPPVMLSTIVAGMWRMIEWNLSVSERLDLIRHCIDLGITSFDHADIYGDYQCEALFGEAIAAQSALRDKIQIVTKCGIRLVSSARPEHRVKRYDTSYEHIVASAENSLRQLRTDYLDCILIHRPDPLMDASEVARAFSDLKKSGKILSAGVSNFLPQQLSLLQSQCDFPLVVNQLEVSVLHTDALFDGSLDYCQQYGMTPMAWSPLAGGKLFRCGDEQSNRVMGVLESIAQEYSVNESSVNKNSVNKSSIQESRATVDQIALAWLLRHPAKIKPVIGSGNLARIKTAIGATQISLSDEHWFGILEASSGAPVA